LLTDPVYQSYLKLDLLKEQKEKKAALEENKRLKQLLKEKGIVF